MAYRQTRAQQEDLQRQRGQARRDGQFVAPNRMLNHLGLSTSPNRNNQLNFGFNIPPATDTAPPSTTTVTGTPGTGMYDFWANTDKSVADHRWDLHKAKADRNRYQNALNSLPPIEQIMYGDIYPRMLGVQEQLADAQSGFQLGALSDMLRSMGTADVTRAGADATLAGGQAEQAYSEADVNRGGMIPLLGSQAFATGLGAQTEADIGQATAEELLSQADVNRSGMIPVLESNAAANLIGAATDANVGGARADLLRGGLSNLLGGLGGAFGGGGFGGLFGGGGGMNLSQLFGGGGSAGGNAPTSGSSFGPTVVSPPNAGGGGGAIASPASFGATPVSFNNDTGVGTALDSALSATNNLTGEGDLAPVMHDAANSINLNSLLGAAGRDANMNRRIGGLQLDQLANAIRADAPFDVFNAESAVLPFTAGINLGSSVLRNLLGGF